MRLRGSSVAAADRTAPGRTSQVCLVRESYLARDCSRSGRPRAGRAVGSEHLAVGSSYPRRQARPADSSARPSAQLPRPSRRSWCWTPQQTVPAGRGAPRASAARWTAAPAVFPGNRRPAGSWVPRQPFGRTAQQHSRVAASGLWKSEGRSIGAYSGPSSHVAMQFIVDAAAAGAVSAENPAAQFG